MTYTLTVASKSGYRKKASFSAKKRGQIFEILQE
jgi:hypothetical protein